MTHHEKMLIPRIEVHRILSINRKNTFSKKFVKKWLWIFFERKISEDPFSIFISKFLSSWYVCYIQQNVRVKLWILIGRKKIVEFWLVCCFLLSISTSGHLFQLVWLERGLLCSRILKWPWRVFLCVSILQANLLHSEKLYKNYCNSNLTYKSATQNCDIFSGRWNFSPNNIAAFSAVSMWSCNHENFDKNVAFLFELQNLTFFAFS